jgi:polysaccharide pyruvyl transferase WcaK-like protein
MDVLGDWPLRDIVPLVRAGDKWKVPFVFVGCGIENLRLSQSKAIVSEELAPRVLHWSVRSDRDRERLVGYGVSERAVTTAADLAWLIEPVTQDQGRSLISQWGIGFERPLVAVNVANENLCFDRHPEMAAELASALDRLVSERDMRVLFVCSEVREGPTFDQAAAHRIMSRMKRSDGAILAPNDYLSPRELMSVISCCHLTITMRYHVCLFSALQRVPFIAIERADKVADLCWDLQWTARVKPPTFTAEELLEHARRLLNDKEAIADQLSQRMNTMKTRSLRNMATLHAIGVGALADVRS